MSNPTNPDTTANDFLRLLGLGGSNELIDPKAFTDGNAPQVSGISTHLVYVNKQMEVGEVDEAATANRDADQAYGLHRDILLNPESEAVFLIESDMGEIEAIALTNPYKEGKPVRYRVGDTEEFNEVVLPPEPWAPHGSVNAIDYEADVVIPPGEDAHIAFYTAAYELRDKIAADTEKLTRGFSSSAVLVTTVFTPITAMPKPDKGFYVHCSIGQMVVAKSSIADEGSPISRTGEIPIDTPNAIQMKMLIHMDKELEAMGVIAKGRNMPKPEDEGDAEAIREAFRRGARQNLHVQSR